MGLLTSQFLNLSWSKNYLYRIYIQKENTNILEYLGSDIDQAANAARVASEFTGPNSAARSALQETSQDLAAISSIGSTIGIMAPDLFLGPLPAHTVQEQFYSIREKIFPLASGDYCFPLRTGAKMLAISFYDSIDRQIETFFVNWAKVIVNENGITDNIWDASRVVIVEKINSLKICVKSTIYSCYLVGDGFFNGTTTNPNLYSLSVTLRVTGEQVVSSTMTSSLLHMQ